MSNYLNCCKLNFSKNDTDLRDKYPDWYSACTFDAGVPIYPFRRGDTGVDCDVYIGDTNYNYCNLGAWPPRGKKQKFENLGLMTGVTFDYTGTTITATKAAHGLVMGGEPFLIIGQTGNNSVLNGSWVVESIPSNSTFTFVIATEPAGALSPATIDFRVARDYCAIYGWKGVQSAKLLLGRNGFVTNYITHPEQSTTRYRAYDVEVSYSQSADEFIKWSDETYSSVGSMGGKSLRKLTTGGVEDCVGILNPALRTGCNYNGSVMGGEDCLVINDDGTMLIPDTANQISISRASLVAMCGVNSDIGIVTCTVPIMRSNVDSNYGNFDIPDAYPTLGFGLVSYVGTPENFPSWLSQFNVSKDVQIGTSGDVGSGHYKISCQNSGSISLFDNKIVIHVSAVASGSRQWQDGSDLSTTSSGEMKFEAIANLTSPYTLAEANDDAKALLNYWDMSLVDVYPWRSDNNCNICPLVSLWEINGGPSWGYCDTPAVAGLLAAYDGSVRGAPINYYKDADNVNYAVAYYNQGWFDFEATIYNYTYQPDTGGVHLCYKYGSYMHPDVPSMATQFTWGALDTDDRDYGAFQPFSRYKESYIATLPPWVNNSGAYVATDGGAVYAAKWVEAKKPLASQNYWGECGVMRDITVLGSTCDDTGTPRYPTAFPICGRISVTNITRNAGTGVVTVTHLPWSLLRTGDAVDFINEDNTLGTGSNIVVTVDSNTQFHFTGALPVGNYIMSHGAPNPVWYDPSPKGYFVRVKKTDGVVAAEEGNLPVTNGIIAIVPPNSPELSRWSARNTVVYTDYGVAKIPSVGTASTDAGWYSAIRQQMNDRFWISGQDDKQSNGEGGCEQKTEIDGITPVKPPQVEARLHAPTGAPMQFASDSANQWLKMPVVTDFGFRCSGAWNLTPVTGGFRTQFGVSTNTADALNTSGISSASDAGWGTADATFIP